MSQNSISWVSQRFQNFNPSCLACCCPCTCAQCLARAHHPDYQLWLPSPHPMYFFLYNQALADIDFSSTTVSKMIVNITTQSRVISYMGCLTQMSLFLLFGSMDDILLTVMAYDQFVAICHSLHYTVIMNPRLCVLLLLVCLFISLFNILLHNLIVLQSSCFKDVEISNFFCHPSQVLNLSCFDT
jgi:olfactory receptor